MAAGDLYRVKATDLNEKLALAYLRLAEQADRNALIDLVYESPDTSSAQQQQQQQQQPQAKTKD
jgi:hypothetical protein